MPKEQQVYAYSAVLMGSPILLKLFEHNDALARQVFRLIKHQENLLTANRSPSEVMNISLAAGVRPVRVNPSVLELVRIAKSVSLLPGSLFNLTIGPLVKCWKIGFHGNRVPSEEELQSRLSLCNPHDVLLDDIAQTVFLAKTGMEIDLGAIAKGYIADCVQAFLRQKGVSNALINLGGNVQTLGKPPGATGWLIGLRKPFAASDELVGIIEVTNRSVVTSGIYERFLEQDGQIYHHILDANTGYPLDNELLSVTIISERSIDGDIYTTLFYGMGMKKSIDYLSDLPDIEAIFITRDKQVICSSQHHFRFTLLDHGFHQR
ncbi:FAD:protein FMN transferase [Halomonas binhaiensis]|uniref:FAD:protein FMN transferase n=1 Tax=Halomonas binhaiensis TaxID=2562282 RepID=A0A5C1NBB7_9GAMM|nr:FAD:protein FMN transferase [Halomonas binhaiensis]QEM80464.1 FAD:protein FMN transferase [Halomonas binhaiensis]